MKKTILMIFSSLLILSVLSSCRPPELEGAFVDYKAGRFESALVLAKEATEKYPSNPEAWYLLGELYGKQGDIKEMVGAFENSLKIGPQFKPQITESRNYYYSTEFNKGVGNYNNFTKLEDKKSDSAVKLLNAALVNFNNVTFLKNDFRVNELIALCYTLLDDKENALNSYKSLTVNFPDSVASWVELGTYFFNGKQYDDAITNYKKAIELDANNAEAITYLAQSYDFLNRRDEAVEAYNKAMQINPQEKAFPFNAGLLFIKAGNEEGIDENLQKEYLAKSIDYFAKALEIDANLKEAYQLKSTSELRIGKFTEAKSTLLAGLDIYPEDGSMWYNLGVSYARLNEKTKSEEAFKKATELGN
ncbi:MAG: tetratricopeptide repeat protein [Calditrichaceae bacterium]